MVVKEKVVLVYRIILLGFTIYALLFYSGILQGDFRLQIFAYFTILSVLLTFLFFSGVILVSLGKKIPAAGQPGAFYSSFKGAVILVVTITMTVYHFLLAPLLMEMGGFQPFTFNDLVVHYLIPLLVILDWLLFDPKPGYRATDPLKWLVLPLLYFLFTIIRAQLGGPLEGTSNRYPYFFIDIDALGMGRVFFNVLILTVGFLALGYIIYFVDHFWGRIQKNKGRKFSGKTGNDHP